jgi:hypothetical protein
VGTLLIERPEEQNRCRSMGKWLAGNCDNSSFVAAALGKLAAVRRHLFWAVHSKVSADGVYFLLQELFGPHGIY